MTERLPWGRSRGSICGSGGREHQVSVRAGRSGCNQWWALCRGSTWSCRTGTTSGCSPPTWPGLCHTWHTSSPELPSCAPHCSTGNVFFKKWMKRGVREKRGENQQRERKETSKESKRDKTVLQKHVSDSVAADNHMCVLLCTSRTRSSKCFLILKRNEKLCLQLRFMLLQSC